MTHSPLLTFALFTYNHAAFIREAVQSAFNQTYQPLEIILSDDCSNDGTYAIMQEMAAAYDGPHQVRLHRTKRNIGAERLGLRFSDVLKGVKGELIIMAAGDDVSVPERSQTLYDLWRAAGKGDYALHSNVIVIDSHGKTLPDEAPDNAIARFSLAEIIDSEGRGLLGASLAITRGLIDRFDKLPDRLWFEDGAFAFRGKLCDGILFAEAPLVAYRRHESNISGSKELMNASAYHRHILALSGLHASFLNDYMQHASKPDATIFRQFARRLHMLEIKSHLFSGTRLQRLRAAWAYGESYSFKRKIWLLLHYGLRKPSG